MAVTVYDVIVEATVQPDTVYQLLMDANIVRRIVHRSNLKISTSIREYNERLLCRWQSSSQHMLKTAVETYIYSFLHPNNLSRTSFSEDCNKENNVFNFPGTFNCQTERYY